MSMVTEIQQLEQHSYVPLPVYASPVEAGFPSPAEDYIENTLDLNELLIKHPAATFMVRVSGDSMKNAGIYHGSILVVDCKINPKPGMIVLAIVENDFTVKRVVIDREKRMVLRAENPNYDDIIMTEDTVIRGVVTGSIVQF